MADSVNMNKINRLNKQYDNKTVNIEDNNGVKHKVKLSVFQEGMAITPDTKGVLDLFDIHKDGKLDKEEVAILKKVIADYAGDDKTLDDNEILKIFGLEPNSEQADKILNQFKTMVGRQVNGSAETTVTDENGNKVVSNFNADGSGTVVATGKNKEGEQVKTTTYYGKGKVIDKKVSETPTKTITSDFTNNENGKPVTVHTTEVDKNGKIIKDSTETFIYDEEGKLIKKEIVEKGKPLQLGDKIIDNKKVTTVDFEYDKEGKLSKKTIQEGGKLPKTTVAEFDKEGHLIHQEITENKLFISKDKNGKNVLTHNKTHKTMDYTYENGKKTKAVIKSNDSFNQPSESVYTYAEDGKTIATLDKSYYSRGAKVEEHYEGANIENRCCGLASEKIEYEEDGKTVKQKTVNKFDEEGILIGRDVYDKEGNIVKQYDFSTLDGKFEVSNQMSRGDCYLLGAINSFAGSEDGQKILQQNVTVTTDENGKKVYTVKFPGAKSVREGLANGTINPKVGKIPEDKIFVQESYTITEDELHEAMKLAGSKYSAGDKDVLLLEVAYEKYRTDAVKTRKENNISDGTSVFGINVASENVKKGDNLSGGRPEETMFLLSAKKPEVYYNPQKPPVCYVDSDLNLHLTDENGNILDDSEIQNITGESNSKMSGILEKLEKDSEDGKIDNYAATVWFNISSQEVNGRTLQNGGHIFSILKVTKDEVTLANPWSPDTPIVMSRAEFEKAAVSVSSTPLNNAAQVGGDDGSGGDDGVSPTQPPKPVRTQPHKGSRSPKGWYRTSGDKSSIVSSLGKNGKKPNASEVTSALLKTKLTGHLTPQQQAELRRQIIRKNPSVFDANGNPKPNADYSKLDVPTLATLRSMFGLKPNQNVGQRRYDDVYSGKVIYTTRNGDYIKKGANGKNTYWTKDGRQMTEAEFRKAHPTVKLS